MIEITNQFDYPIEVITVVDSSNPDCIIESGPAPYAIESGKSICFFHPTPEGVSISFKKRFTYKAKAVSTPTADDPNSWVSIVEKAK